MADNYGKLWALGGAAMPGLRKLFEDKKAPLQPIIKQLMMDIAADTTDRLRDQPWQSLCPHCLLGCIEHTVSLSWRKSLSYYGCRNCHQSREFLQGQAVAVLDQNWSEGYTQKKGIIAINWLKYRRLFDFNEVYIGQATDEDVERLAVQVGNDTDEWRKPCYAQMRCLVSLEASLSENTMRILRRTFKNVIVTDLQTT